MGFGAGGTARLDPLACIICRTLYYDAAKTACQHRFCRFCIAPFRDCPICGADCKPLGADAEMQGVCRRRSLLLFEGISMDAVRKPVAALVSPTGACCADVQRRSTGT
jgi:hypothetical protein